PRRNRLLCPLRHRREAVGHGFLMRVVDSAAGNGWGREGGLQTGGHPLLQVRPVHGSGILRLDRSVRGFLSLGIPAPLTLAVGSMAKLLRREIRTRRSERRV